MGIGGRSWDWLKRKNPGCGQQSGDVRLVALSKQTGERYASHDRLILGFVVFVSVARLLANNKSQGDAEAPEEFCQQGWDGSSTLLCPSRKRKCRPIFDFRQVTCTCALGSHSLSRYLATRDQCSFFGHLVSSSWWRPWQPAIRRLLQKVSRARRVCRVNEARWVHPDLLAPPEFQLRLSVRRLTCV
jgi:hypothetical protein